MSPIDKIRKNGRRLSAIVRAAQGMTILMAFFVVPYMLYQIAEPATHQSFTTFVAEMMEVPALVAVNSWALFQTAVFLWALDRIRLIGKTLVEHTPISLEVSGAVRHASYAWLIYAVTILFKLEMKPQFDLAPANYPVDWSFNLHAFLVACLLASCILIISRILDAAVDLQKENQSFV